MIVAGLTAAIPKASMSSSRKMTLPLVVRWTGPLLERQPRLRLDRALTSDLERCKTRMLYSNEPRVCVLQGVGPEPGHMFLQGQTLSSP